MVILQKEKIYEKDITIIMDFRELQMMQIQSLKKSVKMLFLNKTFVASILHM